MLLYRIDITKTDHGFLASCAAFGTQIDAAVADDAIRACRQECEAAALRLMAAGKPLPMDGPFDMGPHDNCVYFQTNVDDEYEAGNQAPVRRNVSMPAWLDKRLRTANVDASRLFQDAAMQKLKELERERRGVPKISNVKDLEDACLPGVLDTYFRERLARLLDWQDECRQLNEKEGK